MSVGKHKLEVVYCRLMMEDLVKAVTMLVLAGLATLTVAVWFVEGPDTGVIYGGIVVSFLFLLFAVLWGVPINKVTYGKFEIDFRRKK